MMGASFAANTTVTKNFRGINHSVIGGDSAKVLKTDIRWYSNENMYSKTLL